MKVALCSAFRNAAGAQVNRYMRQVALLRGWLGPLHQLSIIAGEGDSDDNTRENLIDQANFFELQVQIVDVSHGHAVFGSVEDPLRMQVLSGVANKMLDFLSPDIDAVVYVESDLIWEPATIAALLGHVRKHKDTVFAPMVFAGNVFYDIYAFRKDGKRFGAIAPYHPSVNGQLTPVDSAGSCLVMPGDIARNVRIQDGGALVGWCKEAWKLGYAVIVDPNLKIYHPL